MTGIWLIQLGTPTLPTPSECKTFIREFLMDERVLDIPKPLRFFLSSLIVQLRARKIARAYESIWLSEGSPLRVHSLKLEEALSTRFKGRALVKLGMTYGSPSLIECRDFFCKNQIDRLLVVPLFPQYASATTGACLQRVFELLKDSANIPSLDILPPFFGETFFIESLASIARKTDLSRFDHFLFSFHGLPERQILKSDSSRSHCLQKKDCCDAAPNANPFCYRSQSFQTAMALAKALDVSEERMTVCFQSRLGRIPWIQPYTDETVVKLAKSGKKRIAVFSPSFVADCLETLEEIGIRAKESFIKNGGLELTLVPSLNGDPVWTKAIGDHLEKRLS